MPRRLSHKLTHLTVKTAKPGRHADGGGLYLLVKKSGSRSWVYRYMIDGKSRDIGLGAAGAQNVPLATARDLAAELRLKVNRGIDPYEEKIQAQRQEALAIREKELSDVSFQDVAEDYLRANEESWRNLKHRQQWRNTLEQYVYPVLGSLPVVDIGTRDVLKVLEPIWFEKPETARRIRGRIETILDAAKAREYRTGENPARWRGHIAQILPARQQLAKGHHKALAYVEVPSFLETLRKREATAALALEFLILTATRTNEVLKARWSEIDLDNAIWIIPAERMKSAKEHRIPLSQPALDVLQKVEPLNNDYLFPSQRGSSLSSMAMLMLLRRMNVDCTVHGFRSSFRDWAAESTGYAHDVCEMALAHTISNKAEAAYRRGDLLEKRKRLMEDWAEFCGSNFNRKNAVVPIRGAKK